MTNKPSDSKPIYVTEFKNQFDEWQLLHATRSKEKAFNDIGRSGRLIEVITMQEHQRIKQELEAENHKLKFKETIERKIAYIEFRKYEKKIEQQQKQIEILRKGLERIAVSPPINIEEDQAVSENEWRAKAAQQALAEADKI